MLFEEEEEEAKAYIIDSQKNHNDDRKYIFCYEKVINMEFKKLDD